MKKFFAFTVLICIMTGVSSAKEIKAWNLNERIHPPAYIMVGNLDPFRDEDIDYAKRLMQVGVPVELHVIPGATHGFEAIFPDSELSIKAVNEYVNALADALR